MKALDLANVSKIMGIEVANISKVGGIDAGDMGSSAITPFNNVGFPVVKVRNTVGSTGLFSRAVHSGQIGGYVENTHIYVDEEMQGATSYILYKKAGDQDLPLDTDFSTWTLVDTITGFGWTNGQFSNFDKEETDITYASRAYNGTYYSYPVGRYVKFFDYGDGS